jgi:tetratricopeptide (TPR) repeat protein
MNMQWLTKYPITLTSTVFTKKKSTSILIALSLLCSNTGNAMLFEGGPNAESNKTMGRYQTVFNAAVQGDAVAVKKTLDLSQGSNVGLSKIQQQQLTIMLGIINKDTDKTTDLLTEFTAEHSTNAEAQIFAGVIWRQLAKQVSFFSIFGTVEKGLEAHVKAFEINPENDYYRALAGSSYTQIDSDNIPKQRALLTGYKAPNSGYHFIALMDMAQNDRDHDLMVEWAEKALKESASKTLVVERAAQAFWTAGNVERAQNTFLKACLLPAPKNILRHTWQNSCYLAGYLALNETEEYQKGIEALTHLLSINKMDTSFNQDVKDVKKDLLIKTKKT